MVRGINLNSIYPKLISGVRDGGIQSKPRGKRCVETRPGIPFSLASPEGGLYTGKNRKLSYRLIAIEALGYIAGMGEELWYADLLCSVSKHIGQFRNPETGLFDGAYGPRIKDSLVWVCEKLQQDNDSRQAVASIWNNEIPTSKYDIPCTLNLQFINQVPWPDKPHLGMIVNMRSNDLGYGTPNDVAAFCAVQIAVADCLGWGLGEYYHYTGSLHYYVDEFFDPTQILVKHDEFVELALPRFKRESEDAATEMTVLQYDTEKFLKWIYDQRTEHGLKFSELKFDFGSIDDITEGTYEYFSDWMKLIQFSWKGK